MKKKVFLVLVCCLFLFACSKAPVKKSKSKKPADTYIPKVSNEKVKERSLKYSAFKTLDLPIPPDNYGKMIEYLIPVNENDKSVDFSLFKKYNEEKVLDYYKNLNLRGLGDNSSYWRWKTSIKKSELYSKIASKLVQISNTNYRNIFTLENDKWVAKKLSNVGKVKEIKVVGRGASGIITHLLITTSNGKYLATKESNIRKLLATNSQLLGAKGGADTYSAKALVASVVSLPSAHLAFEEKNDYIHIYGAGYGHGAGMPQYAAFTLAQRGDDYKDILKRYYNGAKLVNISKILGKDTDIKVGITTSGGRLEHGKLTISSAGNLHIYNKDIDLKLGKNQKVTVISKSGKIHITSSKGKSYTTSHSLNFNAKGYYITISPVVKGHTSAPQYRGTLTLSPYGNSLRVINTLDIEKYLLQVVPSEMPRSFGLEALKAQAVAARTYAVSDIQKQKYIQYGFHIKDTIESQVYNNQVENEDATRAIEETESKILIYDGKPIDAKYFSTSAGFTNFANDIW